MPRSVAVSPRAPDLMFKTIAISVCSLLLLGAVVCWITGALPIRKSGITPLSKRDAAQSAVSEDNLTVYFSPNGGCTEAIVREIGKSSKCVYVLAAQFTYAPIAKALVAAKARGVDVKVVIDQEKNEGEKSEADRLIAGHVPTFSDGRHHTAHNKVILIDHRLIFTGSFNLTRESEMENAENLLLIDGKSRLVDAYETNFREHLSHATPYSK
jgi:phosphatidylserine/phosphatidylglycerophosphate/cardiolipin synthase-like enzyme